MAKNTGVRKRLRAHLHVVGAMWSEEALIWISELIPPERAYHTAFRAAAQRRRRTNPDQAAAGFPAAGDSDSIEQWVRRGRRRLAWQILHHAIDAGKLVLDGDRVRLPDG